MDSRACRFNKQDSLKAKTAATHPEQQPSKQCLINTIKKLIAKQSLF